MSPDPNPPTNEIPSVIPSSRMCGPPRAFAFEVTFDLQHRRLVALASRSKPPLHFHPYQAEYTEVEEGGLCVEVEGDGAGARS